MNLIEALDDYLRELRAQGRGGSEIDTEAVALLREYLIVHCDIAEAEAITVGDLEQLFADWYLRRDDADAASAEDLVSAAEAWLRWLDRRSDGDLARRFAPIATRLVDELPRVLAAGDQLRRYAHREDLDSDLVLGEEGAGVPVSILTSGLQRVVRPEEIDYSLAEEDHFDLIAVDGASATLHSSTRRHLGEPPLAPVRLPSESVSFLRVGDRLHLEVAPSKDGWEILEVNGVFPGARDGDA